jgi:hypothetical protein
MEKLSVFEWHKWYRKGHKNVEDNEGNGHSRSHRTDENGEKVQNVVHSDRHLRIRAMSVQLNLEKETVKGLNFSPMIGFSTTRCFLSSSFWPKN